MLGSVDGSLFQEEIENSHPGIFDANVCISSKNGANDDLKFLEKFFGIGEKTDNFLNRLLPSLLLDNV